MTKVEILVKAEKAILNAEIAVTKNNSPDNWLYVASKWIALADALKHG